MLQDTSARSILNVTLTKMPNAVSLPLCYEVSCQVGRHNSTERETRFIFEIEMHGQHSVRRVVYELGPCFIVPGAGGLQVCTYWQWE